MGLIVFVNPVLEGKPVKNRLQVVKCNIVVGDIFHTVFSYTCDNAYVPIYELLQLRDSQYQMQIQKSVVTLHRIL